MISLRNLNCYLLDMDGTVYLGNNILPGALEFLNYLKETGRDYLFLTNNSSKNAAYYAAKLNRLGIKSTSTDILTSGEATASYINNLKPKAKIYLLGTAELEEEFLTWGFTLTADNPDFVVLGFDMTLTYEKLVIACNLIRANTPYIATHPDFNCPTEDGYIPDCGSMIELIKASTGKIPTIIGKPNKLIAEMAFRKKISFKTSEFAMVGDRIYTDILTGHNAGITSVLVLSGEATLTDIDNAPKKPHYTFSNLGDLLIRLKAEDILTKNS